MKLRAIIFAALTIVALAALNIGAAIAAEETFDKGEKSAIESIVRDYLLAHPEVLIQSMREYTQRQELSERDKIKDKLARLSGILQYHPESPLVGNPQGDITVVEFFDYRCGFCKKVFPTIQKLIKDDGNIRYVLKEFPILGPMSVTASRASLAAWNIDPARYMIFHTSMMTARGQLDEARIFKLAERAGYDAGQIRAGMKDSVVEKEIQTNSRLAQELGINGTPAFIIGEHVIPGAVDMATLKGLVQAARN